MPTGLRRSSLAVPHYVAKSPFTQGEEVRIRG